MCILNKFNFDGVDSSKYGVYISGEATYNAPARRGEKVSIPGRNGDLIIDEGAYENIPVTYRSFIGTKHKEEFDARIEALRAELVARGTYRRLTDTYHPDEFRLGAYREGLEVEPTMHNRAGEFDVVFDCKPQRFLTAGEEEINVGEWGETEEVSGEIATFEAKSNTGIKSLVANIEPIQSGTGDPSPSNVRPISGRDGVNVYDDPKYGGVINWNQLAPSNYSQSTNGVRALAQGTTITAGHKYFVSRKLSASQNVENAVFARVSGANKVCFTINRQDTQAILTSAYSGTSDGSGDTNEGNVWLYQYNGSSTVTVTDLNIIDLTQLFGAGNEPTTVEEFKTLFPKDYYPYNAGEETVISAVNGDPHRHYLISLGRTVYGGTLDAISGVLTVTHKIVTFTNGNGWEWNANRGIARHWLSDIHNADNTVDQYKILVECDRLKPGSWAGSTSFTNYDYGCSAYFGDSIAIYIRGLTTLDEYKAWVAENTPTFRYLLATPQIYQLTPEQVETFVGVNNISADSGEVKVVFGDDPNVMANPTLFEALPLIEVTGQGSLFVDGEEIVISGNDTKYIDSEIMEVYAIEDGEVVSKNDQVVLNEFPKLGKDTRITYNGLSSVKVTPRWWTL